MATMQSARANGFGDRVRRALDSDLWYSFTRSPVTVLSAAITAAIVLAAVFAPWVAPHDPFDLASIDLLDASLPPVWMADGDPRFLLGTDDQGRDVWSTIIFGARISLVVGFAAVIFSLVLGVGLGLVSGYAGGRLDAFIMRVADVQLSFPAILIALLIDGVARSVLPRDLHDELAFYVLVFAIGVSGWVQYARTVRGSTLVAVDDVSLAVEPGDILGVVGESGAGKSTVGNAVIGLLEPPGEMTAGEVHLAGRRIDNLDDAGKRRLRGKRIGMIFQDPLTSLNPLQTVEQQLVETIDVHLATGEAKARRRAVELLAQVGIPEPELRVKQYPHQFSGGMRQRVVIALALSAEPDVIIADEPTTALDVSIQAQILDLMRTLCRERNVGMMIITHDMGVIADITDRVAVMYRGRLVEHGATTKILGHPDHAYSRSLISAVPRPDVKLVRFPLVTYIEDAAEKRRDIDVQRHWLGRARDFGGTGGGPLVSLESLHMRFTTRPSFFRRKRVYLDAVKDVTLDIREGEVFGLVGESGSGKSTVARMICGLHTPVAGAIRFAGTELTALRREADLDPFRRQMQMIFQDPYSSLNPRMRVMDIVAEPIRFHRLAGGREEVEGIVSDLLEQVGLGARAAVRYPHEFSGGQRQRISIARALATRPRFLICDEPTSALDVSIQAQVLNLLKDLQERLGLTMLFISHDLPVIRQMCDRVGVMRGGHLCEVRETEALFESPEHDYTRHLLALMPRLEGLSRQDLEIEART